MAEAVGHPSENDDVFQAILDDNIDKVKEAIQNGFTATSKNSFSDMALHFTCFNSKYDILHILKGTLEEGDIDKINIEEDDTICGTALHMSMDGQVDVGIVDLLLSWGANPNATDAKGSTVLHELIYRAFEEFDNNSMPKSDIIDQQSTESDDDMNINENVEVPNYDTDPVCEHVEDFNGDEELAIAFDYNKYFEKLKLLNSFGADINCVHSGTGLTPLHFWCQNMNWSVFSDTEKEVPRWCFEFLELLFQYGADPHILNDRGDSPLVYLAQRSYKINDVVFMDSYRRLVKIALDKINVQIVDSRDINLFTRNLLHESAEHSNIVFIEELLKRKLFAVSARDKFQLTPIHISTHNLQEDEVDLMSKIMQVLVQNGADVNTQDFFGLTPLHHAVILHNNAAVKCLLSLKGKPDITDKKGKTAVSYAEIIGNAMMLNMFGISTPHIPKVSDARFGLFYPLCCQTEPQSMDEIPPTVMFKDIKDWLTEHVSCEHNRKFILQNCIPSLETNKEQRSLADEDANVMKTEMYEFALRISDEIGKLNELFKTVVLFGGSVFEGTKIGNCDEFDLVFDLYNLRKCVDIHEMHGCQHGFVRLQVTEPDVLRQHGMDQLMDTDGFLNRLEVGKTFHKYLEKVLSMEKTWGESRFMSFWGTTNAAGECYNIGQLNLAWYGSFFIRNDVSLDIAPVLRITDWQTTLLNEDIKIIDRRTVSACGCYLMLKGTENYLQPDEDAEDDISGSLFKISISQMEHGCMQHMPPMAKAGYKIAKCLKIQCPVVLCDVLDIITCGVDTEQMIETVQYEDKSLATSKVGDFLTSYAIKTGLFHELHSRNINLQFRMGDITPETWNRFVIKGNLFDTTPLSKAELQEALSWALAIVKQIRNIAEKEKRLPEYFLPSMDATKVVGGSESFRRVMTLHLDGMIFLLENYSIPDGLC